MNKPTVKTKPLSFHFFFWGGASLLFLLSISFPGDAPWINDEPKLLAKALNANIAGTYERIGLVGSVKLPYGPLPTWCYQVLLFLTSNLLTMVIIQTALCVLIPFFAVYKIAKRLHYPLLPLLLLLASPYFFFYARLLWDNPFLIPGTALLLWAYAEMTERRSIGYFFLILFFLWAIIYIHLMAFFIVFPLGVCFLLFDRKWLFQKPRALFLGILGFLTCLFPYARILFETERAASRRGSPSRLDLFENSLSGANYFTFRGFPEYFIPEFAEQSFIPENIFSFLFLCSGFALIFFLGGFLKSLPGIFLPLKGETPTLERKLTLLSFLVVLTSVLTYQIVRLPHHPHYLNSAWFAFFFFIWRFLAEFQKSFIVRIAFAAHLFSLVALLVLFMGFVHTNGGNRTIHHGATLSNQLAVINELREYRKDIPLEIQVQNYKRYPHSLSVLRRVVDKNRGEASGQKQAKKLIIEYSRPENSTGFIKLTPVNSS